MAAEKQKTFEANLQELERIVRNLENGDLALEESLKLFEDGVRLSRECQERLNQAERRIEILMRDGDGNPALETVRSEDLRGEAAEKTSEPKVKRRIVFDTDDESPF